MPSGHWGYIHFPLTVRYARTLGLPCLRHTGKFHTAWGDFHSFKNQEALEYECFRMMAHGAGPFVGDQLPPDGRIEEHVYNLIGKVYTQVESKEDWCIGAEAISDVAVMTPEEFAPLDNRGMQPSICGIHSMLQEAGHQFDIVDSQADFSDYKVLILPDDIPVNAALKRKIDDYLAGGGGLIASSEPSMRTPAIWATPLPSDEIRASPDGYASTKAYSVSSFCVKRISAGVKGFRCVSVKAPSGTSP